MGNTWAGRDNGMDSDGSVRAGGATVGSTPAGSQPGASNPPHTHATDEGRQAALDDYPICQRFHWGKEKDIQRDKRKEDIKTEEENGKEEAKHTRGIKYGH